MRLFSRPRPLDGRRFWGGLAALFVFALLAAGMARPVLAQSFVPGIEDLPLMPGLTLQPGAVVFDKPTGRIVEAAALGSGLKADAVRDFYRRTLAGLGWHEGRDERRSGALTFVREGEKLVLLIEPQGMAGTQTEKGRAEEGRAEGVRVQFDVAPR